jgi:hypothetical protein
MQTKNNGQFERDIKFESSRNRHTNRQTLSTNRIETDRQTDKLRETNNNYKITKDR